MEKYETMLYGTLDLDNLTAEERAIFEEIKTLAEKDSDEESLDELFDKRVRETGVLKKRTGYQHVFQQPLCRLHSDICLRLRLKLQARREQEEKKKKQK